MRDTAGDYDHWFAVGPLEGQYEHDLLHAAMSSRTWSNDVQRTVGKPTMAVELTESVWQRLALLLLPLLVLVEATLRWFYLRRRSRLMGLH